MQFWNRAATPANLTQISLKFGKQTSFCLLSLFKPPPKRTNMMSSSQAGFQTNNLSDLLVHIS